MFKSFLVLFLFALQVWARPEIYILENVEVSPRDNIRLLDIVELKNHDVDLINILKNISVKQIGGDEQIIKLKSKEILSFLKLNEEIKKVDPIIHVPSEVKVAFSTKRISKSEIERRISNQLNARCFDCIFEVNITQIPSPTDMHWDLKLDNIPLKGSILIPMIENMKESRHWIAGVVRLQKKVQVATHLLKYGERIQAGDFENKYADITYIKDTPATNNLIGNLVNKSINPGNAILVSDILREPVVKRGQIITAVAGEESFEITTQMTAEENGFVGDIIKIKSNDMKKYFSAVVENNGVVRIR